MDGTVQPNCADVPLRIYSLTHSLVENVRCFAPVKRLAEKVVSNMTYGVSSRMFKPYWIQLQSVYDAVQELLYCQWNDANSLC